MPAQEPEPFQVPSPGGDGDDDAWLVRPAEPAPGERVPVLLSIHGGPMSQYANSWLDEFQLWAGAGYAVVYCNPHGSTGRTDAWMIANTDRFVAACRERAANNLESPEWASDAAGYFRHEFGVSHV